MQIAAVPGPASGAPRRWRPAPLVRASFVVHGAALAMLVCAPAYWPWVVGLLLANHAVICLTVLWLHGGWLGAVLTRLPAAAARRGEVSLNFDDGPDPRVTPQVLDLLDRHHAKASFFCVGEKAAAHPELLREMVRRGHSVENHTQHHSPGFSVYGVGRLGRELDGAQAAIAAVTGRAPVFFRAPAGFRSPLLDPLLAHRGLTCVSWTRRGFDSVETDPARVLQRLSRNLAAGDLLLLHDVAPARDAAAAPMVLAVLPPLLDLLAARGLKSVSLPAAFGDVPA